MRLKLAGGQLLPSLISTSCVLHFPVLVALCDEGVDLQALGEVAKYLRRGERKGEGVDGNTDMSAGGRGRGSGLGTAMWEVNGRRESH